MGETMNLVCPELERIKNIVVGRLSNYIPREDLENTEVEVYYYNIPKNSSIVVISPRITLGVDPEDEDEFLKTVIEDISNSLRNIGWAVYNYMEQETRTVIILKKNGDIEGCYQNDSH